MQRRDINAADAPAPAGQYTQAVEVTGASDPSSPVRGFAVRAGALIVSSKYFSPNNSVVKWKFPPNLNPAPNPHRIPFVRS